MTLYASCLDLIHYLIVGYCRAEALKITYQIENWPWAGSSDYVLGWKNNASYLSFWFLTSCTSLDCITIPFYIVVEVNYVLTTLHLHLSSGASGQF